MEQDNKKRRTGQNVAFYTALAVCLIAVGVGTWELLQPEKTGDGASAVSSAVALPDGGNGVGAAPDASDGLAFGPDGLTGDGADASTDGGDIPTSGAASIAESASDGVASDADGVAPDAAKTDADASKATSGAASPAKSDAKSKDSGAKSKDADAKSDKSDAKSKDAKSDKTDAKSKDAKSDKADAKSKDGKGAAKPSGDAVRPVEGETVTGFSMDKLLYNETMRDWRTHDGVDIAADKGTAVVAARPGTVESVAADPIMGTTVTIRHADKWESVYASLADMPEVEAGDDVIAGQVLGFVGETAASESALGPHLHFSVLNDGVPVDPETFLA